MAIAKQILVGKLLAQTFRPAHIKIDNPFRYIKANQIETIYKNELFGILASKFTYNKSQDLIIDYNKTISQDKYLLSPAVIIRNLLNYHLDTNIDQSANQCSNLGVRYNFNKCDGNFIYFNTTGNIPIRWFHMLHDFSKLNIEIVPIKGSEYVKFEENEIIKVSKIPIELLDNIVSQAYLVSHFGKKIIIKVNKAPKYDPILLESHLYRKPFRYQIAKEDVENQLESREWKTSDGDFCSPGANIFLNRSYFYQSLGYYNNVSEIFSHTKYNFLFSASGGISLDNIRYQPWCKFLDGYFQNNAIMQYCDFGHEDVYYNNKEINNEEVIIFKEILKKENVKFDLHIN
jgi:hypothetical protein